MESKRPAKKATSKSTASKSGIAKTAVKAKAKTPAKKDAAKKLKDLFEDSLKDIYWAEKALVKALPVMMKNATDEKLKSAIKNHISETENQIDRLEACFKAIGKKAQERRI